MPASTIIEVCRWHDDEFTAGTPNIVKIQSDTYPDGDGTGLCNFLVIKSRAGEGPQAVERITTRNPFQDGTTDIGHKLSERTITFEMEVVATSQTQLDSKINQLLALFSPVRAYRVMPFPVFFSSPGNHLITLRYTLPSGKQRCIDGYLAKCEINTAQRRGWVQPVTLQFRCPNPIFYNPTGQTVNFTGGGGTAFLNYNGTYPDYEPWVFINCSIGYVSGFALLNPSGFYTPSSGGGIVSVPKIRFYYVGGSPYNREKVVDFSTSVAGSSFALASANDSVILEPKLKKVYYFSNNVSGYKGAVYSDYSAYLSDASDYADLAIYPSYSNITGGSVTTSCTINATYSGAGNILIVSFEKFLALESQ